MTFPYEMAYYSAIEELPRRSRRFVTVATMGWPICCNRTVLHPFVQAGEKKYLPMEPVDDRNSDYPLR